MGHPHPHPPQTFGRLMRAAADLVRAAAVLDHTTPLNTALPPVAARLLPCLDLRTAKVALLDIRTALDRAGSYENADPSDLPSLQDCLNQPPPPPGDRGLWAARQAEAWRELAWAIAVNTVHDAQLAAAVTR